MRTLLILAIVFGLAACRPEEDRRDEGYNDGFAVGYNTACQRRAGPLEGDWDNASYSEGYADGVTDGILACLAEG
jgi:hypothetical protein